MNTSPIENKTVSIIVPVYNVKAEYLTACMDSIMRQVYTDFEVILVDDGSSNGAEKICDQFAEKDSRIRVLHQENQGVSDARNNGLMMARGEYVTYIDSDDVVSPLMLQTGINALYDTGADMTICAVAKINDYEVFQYARQNGQNLYQILRSDNFDGLRTHYLTGKVKNFADIDQVGYISRGPVARIIRIEIAKSVPFLCSMPIGEDILWNMVLLNQCKDICVINAIHYGYLKHSDSAITKYYGNRETIAENYLERLWNDNQEFCKSHINEYGYNTAVEFYCVINYDLMSDKCKLNRSEKIRAVKQMFSHNPWKLLNNKKIRRTFPVKHRLLIMLCSSGCWVYLLGAYNKIKDRQYCKIKVKETLNANTNTI